MQVAQTQKVTHDADKWDLIHKKIHVEHDKPSIYAQDREQYFPRGSVVCELGGGTGADARYFLSKGHSVILLDISLFALKIAQNRAQKAGLAQNLVTQQIDFGLHTLPLKDESVDVVFSRISLNYFGHRHTARILLDINRVLKPGGSAYLTFKSPVDTKEMERLHKLAVPYEPGVFIEAGHLRSRFTIDQLQQVGEKAGLLHFTVNPYNEKLPKDRFGREHILFQNEVIIKKPPRRVSSD